ncbi:hypothetical protein [Kitasatospora sp. NPDC054795]
MYQTAAPVLARTRDRQTAAPLRLAGITHRVFGTGTTRIDDAFSERHFTDLTGAYGIDYRPELTGSGAGNTFAAMSRALVESLGATKTRVDLAVVAHTTPDLDCRAAAATYLSDAWPHGPLAFSLSEQGPCTPFTALRLAQAYARRHDYQQVLVLVLDQATLPYATGRDLAGDAGVAMLLTRDGALGAPRTEIHPGVRVERLRDRLAALLPAAEQVNVLAGPGIVTRRDLPDHPDAVGTAPGYPTARLWGRLAGQPAARTVVLVDHDETTGDLALCTLDRAAEAT